MTGASRRFPPPWRADKVPGGYVVRDASGIAWQGSMRVLVLAMSGKRMKT
jgi:hypothetical protein